ncbi:hypothetical protein [Paucihalobacter sp.]|uniref:hypothetical protein n=1 Tax=Paucihalobacter sp. TaxID=2850405 RepID=UPI002FDF0DC9
MAQTKLSHHDTLLQNIAQLKIDKQEKEVLLRQSFTDVVDSLNPFKIAKDSLNHFVNDDEVKSNLASGGIKLGYTLLSNKLLGKYNSIKGFVGAIISENVFEGLIKNNTPGIILAFDRFFFPKSRPKY